MGFEIVTLSFKGNNSEDSIRNFKKGEFLCNPRFEHPKGK